MREQRQNARLPPFLDVDHPLGERRILALGESRRPATLPPDEGRRQAGGGCVQPELSLRQYTPARDPVNPLRHRLYARV